MQLDMILASLQDNHQISALFACVRVTPATTSDEKSMQSELQMTELLMKALLKNLGFWTVSCFMSY